MRENGKSLGTVVFRADASTMIGTGHVMRCLALARELGRRSARCVYLTREMPPAISETVAANGCEILELDPGVPDGEATAAAIAVRQPDWVVVDHYGLDAEWRADAVPPDIPVLAIDDLADRKLDCEVLLDQTHGRTASDYDDLVPESATRLVGGQYALLRPEFAEIRPAALSARAARDPARLLLSLGGTDPGGATVAVLREIAKSGANWPRITVVLGGAAATATAVRAQAEMMQTQVDIHVASRDVAALMRDSDLAIGAGGTMSWERCCLGLPTGIVLLADNQVLVAESLVAAGAAELVGDLRKTADLGGLGRFVRHMGRDRRRLQEMSKAAAAITDGKGASRVADLMIAHLGQ